MSDPTPQQPPSRFDARSSRRGFVSVLGTLGVATAAGGLLAACNDTTATGVATGSSALDAKILAAAATAEALASVMYDNIIKLSPAYRQLGGNANDQAYLAAGRQQEAIHYNTLVGAGGKPLALDFYFPTGMFTDPSFRTTVNTLVTLEDAFIAAYLIGIRDFSTSGSRVLAGQILGVEAEHRAFARVIAADLGLGATTGLSGVAESVTAPTHAANNLAYERTFGTALKTIDDVVTALTPFVTPGTTGFDATKFSFNTTANYYLSQPPGVTLDSTTP